MGLHGGRIRNSVSALGAASQLRERMMVHVVLGKGRGTGAVSPMLATSVFDDGRMDPSTAEIDRALGGAIQRLIEQGEISGKRYDATVIHTVALLNGANAQPPAERVVVVGRSKREELNLETIRCVAAVSAKAARDMKVSRFTMTPIGESAGNTMGEICQ